jgi:hypothetical protein
VLAPRQLQARPLSPAALKLCPLLTDDNHFRRWEQHAHAQAQAVEATLEKVRSMQNDMSNLSLDALVTLKHELSGRAALQLL